MPTVNVSVSSAGVIACSPDPVQVSGPNVTITFNLQTSGYRYPGNAAVVVTNPGSQFPHGSVTASSILVTILDVNSVAGHYKYTINLVKTADNSSLSLDPTIENEGSAAGNAYESPYPIPPAPPAPTRKP